MKTGNFCGQIHPFSWNNLYADDVSTKIANAQTLFNCYGDRLRSSGQAVAVLKTIRQRADNLQEVMVALGMPRFCTACGARSEGGCCSAEMANETDAILILMNMLLAQEVARQREDGLECIFLGAKGCSLFLKPIFCLNYNCTKIKHGLSPAELFELERVSARLLQEQLVMEELILAAISFKVRY